MEYSTIFFIIFETSLRYLLSSYLIMYFHFLTSLHAQPEVDPGIFLWDGGVGRSVFQSLFQILLIGVLSLSLGSIEMMGILFSEFNEVLVPQQANLYLQYEIAFRSKRKIKMAISRSH